MNKTINLSGIKENPTRLFRLLRPLSAVGCSRAFKHAESVFVFELTRSDQHFFMERHAVQEEYALSIIAYLKKRGHDLTTTSPAVQRLCQRTLDALLRRRAGSKQGFSDQEVIGALRDVVMTDLRDEQRFIAIAEIVELLCRAYSAQDRYCLNTIALNRAPISHE